MLHRPVRIWLLVVVLLLGVICTTPLALAATHRPSRPSTRKHPAARKRAKARSRRKAATKSRRKVVAKAAVAKSKRKSKNKSKTRRSVKTVTHPTAPVTTPAPVTAPAPVASPPAVTAPAPVASPAPVTTPAPVASPAPVTTPAPVASPAPVTTPAPVSDPASTTSSAAGTMPVVSVVGVPVISGTTYYVSPDGSDSASGTSPARAWRTVGRVNAAHLEPGDGVLFEGGQTFGDADLEPGSSGVSGDPIVFGSYGQGDAVLSLGAWFVQHDLVFDHLQFGATVYGGSEVHGPSNDITVQNCVFALPAGNQQLGLFGDGTGWKILDNTVRDTGLSGMLLWGDGFVVSGNTIDNVGLYDAGYNAHGIYLDASNSSVTDNTITRFSESAVSARYRSSTIERNYMSGGQIGIDFYQSDPQAGTSHWQDNTITNTTAAGIYVSSDGDYPLQESFVISNNVITPASGVVTNLHPTGGTYTLAGQTL